MINMDSEAWKAIYRYCVDRNGQPANAGSLRKQCFPELPQHAESMFQPLVGSINENGAERFAAQALLQADFPSNIARFQHAGLVNDLKDGDIVLDHWQLDLDGVLKIGNEYDVEFGRYDVNSSKLKVEKSGVRKLDELAFGSSGGSRILTLSDPGDPDAHPHVISTNSVSWIKLSPVKETASVA